MTTQDKPVHDPIPDVPTAIAIQMTILNERLLPLIEISKQHEITLRGEKGSTGLVGDVNDLKGAIGTIRKLSWLAVASGIGTLATLIATHIHLQVP